MTEDTKIILERLNQMDSKINQMDSKISQMDSKISQMDSKISQMDSKIGQMDSKIGQLDSRMDRLESKVDTLESDMDDVKAQVVGVKLILENEIRRNIMIVAEGHLDLYRKLDDALRTEEEREMLLVRINMLESDVKTLKNKVDSLSSVSR